MNTKMPDISFERNMNHNYMILTKRDYFGNVIEDNSDYRKKMLLENDIAGLLPVKHRLVNGEMRYYYEINSLQSLASLYNRQEINYEELKHILGGCVKLFESLEEYLLDGSQVILKPEYIYMNPDSLEVYFVCYPEYEEDIRVAFVEFVDLLLTKIDHKDNNAVLLSYKVYRYTKNPNYVMSEIRNIVLNHTPQTKPQEPPKLQEFQIPQYCNELSYTNEFENNIDNFNDIDNINDIDIDLETDYDQRADKNKGKKDKNSIGIILCLAVTLITAGVILGDRMTHFIGLKADVELYLYGIIAVAIAEMVILSISRAKKRKSREEAMA